MQRKYRPFLAGGIANTRLRDYYDVYMIAGKAKYDMDVLRQAFSVTCNKRNTVFDANQVADILSLVENDDVIKGHWIKYSEKNEYARNLEWLDVITGVKMTIQTIIAG